ncbi:MAG TPA: translation elongation factor Ts [Bacteroidales bacterium]|nr:translation elongation factor Ts [Bacteroidales bacterium]
MTNITAAEVNKLRQITGAGIMDCKQALIESGGDSEKAIEYLRKKGQKVANKRADRSANEGIVLAKVDEEKEFGAMIMLNCETDFVGKTQEFIDVAKSILDLAISEKPADLEALNALKLGNITIADRVMEMTGKTGEKIGLNNYETIQAPIVFAYNHHGNRLSSMAGFNTKDVADIDNVGHDVVMQIAAMSPVAIDRDDVPKEVVDKEIEIGKDIAIQEGKPEELAEKIARGKLEKFFKENTLLNQEFIKDSGITVKEYITRSGKDLKVTAMKRLMLGA